MRIYISCASGDTPWCSSLSGKLKLLSGHDVWFDDQSLGSDVQRLIARQQKLLESDVVLVAVTPDSWKSEALQDEIALALIKRKRIVPMLLVFTIIDGFLLTRQWVNVENIRVSEAARKVMAALDLAILPLPPVDVVMIDDMLAVTDALSATATRLLKRINAEGDEDAVRDFRLMTVTAPQDASPLLKQCEQQGNPLLVISGILSQTPQWGLQHMEHFLLETFFNKQSLYFSAVPLIVYSGSETQKLRNRLKSRPHSYAIDKLPHVGEQSPSTKIKSAMYDCLLYLVSRDM